MHALVAKGQSNLLRTWTLRPDNAVEPVHHQNRTNEVHVPTANDGEHLSALITFKFSAKITHIHGIPTPGHFHIDRSGGHVVPRWKSPDVMVNCEFMWKSPDIIGLCVFGWKSPRVMVSVSSGENHPRLWLVRSGENHPMLWLEWVFGFPVSALTLHKLTKLH